MADETIDTFNRDPWHRLGRANELLAQIANPASALNLGRRVYGDDYLIERITAHLDGEERYAVADGREPMVYGMTPAPVVTAVAASEPWPAHATAGLFPGDRVTHPLHGEGMLVGFSDDQWAAALPLVAGGRVLVRFTSLDGDGAMGAEHWVPADTLGRIGAGEVF